MKSGLNSQFWQMNEVFLPSPEASGREGLTEWKAKIGDCVQDMCSEALFSKCSFWRNAGECAERIKKTIYSHYAGFKADLTLKV